VTADDGARERLAAAQAALTRALLAGADTPPGFDRRRLRVEARALLNKRRRVTELLRPDLADALGERYAPLFDAWGPAHPRRVGVTAHADAHAFGEWLVEHGHLPPQPVRRSRSRWRLRLRPRLRPRRPG
jgi:hypothetical protein